MMIECSLTILDLFNLLWLNAVSQSYLDFWSILKEKSIKGKERTPRIVWQPQVLTQ